MTKWGEAAALTLIKDHQIAIEMVVEICHIKIMEVNYQQITMVTVITHTAFIHTTITPEPQSYEQKLSNKSDIN